MNGGDGDFLRIPKVHAATAISADGRNVAKGRIERSVPIRISWEHGLDVDKDAGTPVNLKYDAPFQFTGKIEEGTIELK